MEQSTSLLEEQPKNANGANDDHQERTTSKYVPVPLPSSSKGWVFFALILQGLTIALLVVFSRVDVWITKDSVLTNTSRAGYVTAITIIGTLISTYTSSQIRKLLVTRFASTGTDGRAPLPKAVRMLAVAVGLGSLSDSFTFWFLPLSFTACGLVTAAFAAALTPSIVSYVITTESTFYLGLPTNPQDHSQLYGNCYEISSNQTAGWFTWKMANGSFLTVNSATDSSCANAWVQPTLKTNSLIAEPGYSYTIGEVSVASSAVGAPYNIYSHSFNFDFGLRFATGPSGWDAAFQWASQCLPVVALSPVQCEATGSLERGNNSLTVDAGGCQITTPIYGVDPQIGSATAMGACSNINDRGKATIVIGSTGQHAIRLANIMFDAPAFNSLWGNTIGPSNQTYTVACTIDITPSIAFRALNFSHVNQVGSDIITGIPTYIPYSLVGEDFCTPSAAGNTVQVKDVLTDGALATGAAAPLQLLTENIYNDGWWETLCEITSCNDITTSVHPGRRDSIIFNNSRNQLEDKLGLAGALGLSMFWGQEGQQQEYAVSIEGGRVSLQGVRVGPGDWWSIFYILPSVSIVILILYLLWDSYQRATTSRKGSA